MAALVRTLLLASSLHRVIFVACFAIALVGTMDAGEQGVHVLDGGEREDEDDCEK